ncbi:MAG: LemA family protein [Blastocatellia bacterium]|nr:LemA family protein [Blastocatellia bacterium]
MFKLKMLSTIVFTAIVFMSAGNPGAQAQTKPMIKDEVYTSIARRLNAASESPVTAIVAEVDTVIEVTEVAMEKDGKATATVKERTENGDAGKSMRLKFAPPASGEQWTWVEFEDKGRFYAVEKLFPYVKDELGKRRQETDARWTALISSINKQGEAANKMLETAKSIIKSDPPPLEPLKNSRNALAQAIKDKEKDTIVSSCLEILQQSEAISSLGDSYSELKANDAYLRLFEEYKKTIEASQTARKDYVQSIVSYNDSLVHLPFSLAAYGFQFTKIEPNIAAE